MKTGNVVISNTQERLHKVYSVAKAQALKVVETEMLDRDEVLAKLEQQMEAEFALKSRNSES